MSHVGVGCRWDGGGTDAAAGSWGPVGWQSSVGEQRVETAPPETRRDPVGPPAGSVPPAAALRPGTAPEARPAAALPGLQELAAGQGHSALLPSRAASRLATWIPRLLTPALKCHLLLSFLIKVLQHWIGSSVCYQNKACLN